MATSTWFIALLTLLATIGTSYFLRLGPTSNSSTSGAPIESDVGGYTAQNGLPADVEVDRRLPPLKDQCLACNKKSEELGKPLLRCSQCKNAFYCVSRHNNRVI